MAFSLKGCIHMDIHVDMDVVSVAITSLKEQVFGQLNAIADEHNFLNKRCTDMGELKKETFARLDEAVEEVAEEVAATPYFTDDVVFELSSDLSLDMTTIWFPQIRWMIDMSEKPYITKIGMFDIMEKYIEILATAVKEALPMNQ